MSAAGAGHRDADADPRRRPGGAAHRGVTTFVRAHLRRYASACALHFLLQVLVRLIHWSLGDTAMALSPFGRGIARLEGWVTMPFVPVLHRVGLQALDLLAWIPNSLVWGLALFVLGLPLLLRR